VAVGGAIARVPVKPELLRWAVERSRVDPLTRTGALAEAWLRGAKQPTLRQLEAFAKATYTPLGYFFLPEPPVDQLPIQDFRTVRGEIERPSANLLDTVYAMQRRQDFLREDRREGEAEPLDFVGSARLDDEPEAIGRAMRRVAGLDEGWAATVGTWTEAIGALRQRIESLGVVVVINGVVGNNTSRKLDVREFRGFALTDVHAPFIFVNGADAKSAQMFTLAHELAHVWLGRDGEGLSGFDGLFPGEQRVERFCDRAAAEFLVPAAELQARWPRVRADDEPFEHLARHFKVSPIVAARRAMDLRLVTRQAFFAFYEDYTQRERRRPKASGGGDFYNTQNTRVGQGFALAVMRAALDGRVSFKEAYDLTGLRGGAFQEYGRRLGVPLP
jgi:Zn-dependent peptidase ImmA (M78 family)